MATNVAMLSNANALNWTCGPACSTMFGTAWHVECMNGLALLMSTSHKLNGSGPGLTGS